MDTTTHSVEAIAGQTGTHLDQVEDRLITRYQNTLPPDEVRRAMRDEAHRFDDAPVRSFVPILVERAVRARLDRPA
ncbi:three-helix bundle dimerization domain-containing protein [Kibdelosporangium aridum]|uniref:three-helix bundle dimerization domain-containing protein n=1 Tax=Kibdelosporangium aridum TaxID=2030 RepID=UPI000A87662E